LRNKLLQNIILKSWNWDILVYIVILCSMEPLCFTETWNFKSIGNLFFWFVYKISQCGYLAMGWRMVIRVQFLAGKVSSLPFIQTISWVDTAAYIKPIESYSKEECCWIHCIYYWNQDWVDLYTNYAYVHRVIHSHTQVKPYHICLSDREITLWAERELYWWGSTIQESNSYTKVSHWPWWCDQLGPHGTHLAPHRLLRTSRSTWRISSSVDRSASELTSKQRKNNLGMFFLSFLFHGCMKPNKCSLDAASECALQCCRSCLETSKPLKCM